MSSDSKYKSVFTISIIVLDHPFKEFDLVTFYSWNISRADRNVDGLVQYRVNHI